MAQAGAGADAKLLNVFCLVTTAIAAVLSLRATFIAVRNGVLDVIGRRPEPTIAALLCSLAWLVFGLVEDQAEPVWLNAFSSVLHVIYLCAYLWLCNIEEIERAIMPVLCAAIYLGFAFTMGMVEPNRYKWLCTLAGLLSAAAPLLTAVFLDHDMLPSWGMACFSMVHRSAWCLKGLMMPGGPDFFMAAQNGLGAFCSFLLLLLARNLPGAQGQPNAQDMNLLAAVLNPDILPPPLFADRLPPRRRSTGADFDTLTTRRHHIRPPLRCKSTGTEA